MYVEGRFAAAHVSFPQDPTNWTIHTIIQNEIFHIKTQITYSSFDNHLSVLLGVYINVDLSPQSLVFLVQLLSLIWSTAEKLSSPSCHSFITSSEKYNFLSACHTKSSRQWLWGASNNSFFTKMFIPVAITTCCIQDQTKHSVYPSMQWVSSSHTYDVLWQITQYNAVTQINHAMVCVFCQINSGMWMGGTDTGQNVRHVSLAHSHLAFKILVPGKPHGNFIWQGLLEHLVIGVKSIPR